MSVEGESTVLPPEEVCRHALLTRDAKFDGRVFIAARTTKVYCRPACRTRRPNGERIQFYASAAAAQDAGLRPCPSCRPEWAQPPPEWTLSNNTVLRGLRLIESGFLNEAGTGGLAAKLGVSRSRLVQLFVEDLGASPAAIARLRRVRLARDLLEGTNLSRGEIARHAGFGGAAGLSAALHKTYQRSATRIRRETKAARGQRVQVNLSPRGPYDCDWMFEYLKRRALAGIESVRGRPGSWTYSRRLREGGCVEVQQTEAGLRADMPIGTEPIYRLLNRIRCVFDLHTDGDAIHAHLIEAPLLSEWVKATPGLRVPGAWDGYETAVRAVLGQQVSVERGTVLANKMIVAYGDGEFPKPEQIIDREVAEIGMPGQRGRAISRLSQAVLRGELALDDCQDYGAIDGELQQIPGIGPWTANYIRMRVLKDPNAFPDNDWVVLKALNCTAAKARKRAEPWQPWRAYGLMYLWSASKTLKARQVSE